MKKEAEERRAREAAMMQVEMRPFSSHTLKRLLRFPDLRLSNIKAQKSAMTPTSPLDDAIEETVEEDSGAEDNVENEIENAELKKEADVDARTAGEAPKKSSSYLTLRVDSATNLRDSLVVGDAEKKRSPGAESREFAADFARTSSVREAVTKDADGRVSEVKIELVADVSEQDSSSEDDAPRSVCPRRMLLIFVF